MWIDPDPAKIQWGIGKRRADATRGIYFDLGPDKEPPKIDPEPLAKGARPVLLDLADVYAYAAAQVVTREGKLGEWFRELYRLIDPEEAIMEPNPEPKWADARKPGE